MPDSSALKARFRVGRSIDRIRPVMGHREQHEHNSTSLTLLHTLRVNPHDESAWARFLARYQPLILHWCRQRGLQENDAADVAQDVMHRLARFIRKFEHNQKQSFRSWLKTVTQNAWHDWVQKEKKYGGNADHGPLLHSLEARDELVERLEQEYNQELMNLALLRVQLRVTEPVWKAFELTALQGKGGIEVAKQLGVDAAKIYSDKSRVTGFLQEEIRRLES